MIIGNILNNFLQILDVVFKRLKQRFQPMRIDK